MFWGKRYDAFISYSHKDAEVVKPLVELLSLNDRRVFWDQELAPGDRWNQVVRSSVKRSSIFVLFWCCDTGQSDYTAEEITLALRLKKKIVPVKLCHAAMPQPLAQWQWIDLQKRVEHHCTDLDHQVMILRNAEAIVLDRRFTAMKLALASACLVLLVAAMFFSFSSERDFPHPGNLKHRVNPTPALARIPVPEGFAVVYLPVSVAYPPGYYDGAIIVYDMKGDLIHRYPIPSQPPEPALNFEEQPVPWWYANRAILLAAVIFAAAVAFFTWIIWTNRRRTAHTLSITKDYLKRLAYT